jgi:hypothetical protein
MKRGTYYLNNKGRWQLYIYKYNKFRRNICILSPSIPSSILLCDLRKQRREILRSKNGLLCVHNYAIDIKATKEYNMWCML